MHWAQYKRIGRIGIKCLTSERSSSISESKRTLPDKRMVPRPETQPYQEEATPLLGARNPEEGEEKRTKKVRFASGPDGALAWVVAFANFVINLAVVGLGRMSGILYVVLMKRFNVDRRTASYPFSVQQAARNLFGPLAGILGQKYGVRNVTIGGGIIGVISAVTCYFAMDMNWITVMWGLVFGICTALTTTLNQVTIDQYFEKYRTSAGGLAFSGGCVGAFFFPIVLDQLLSHYGIKGTFLAMGAIILVVVPSAMFLREPPWKKAPPGVKGCKVNGNNYSTFSHDANVLADDASVTATFPGRSRVDFRFLRDHCEIVYQLFALTVAMDEVSVDASIDWSSFEPEPLVQQMENMHTFFTTPEEAISDSSGSVVDELTHNVREVKIVNQEDLRKESEKNSKAKSPRWHLLASKLKELKEKETEEVLSYFPFHLHLHIQKVLLSLKALSDEVQPRRRLPDQVQEDAQTPHLMQVRKISHSMESLKSQVEDLSNSTKSDPGASVEDKTAFHRVLYVMKHLKKDVKAIISDAEMTEDGETYHLKSKLQVVKVLQSVKSLSEEVQTLIARINTSEGQPNSKGSQVLRTMKTLHKEITDLANHTEIKNNVLNQEQKERNNNSFLSIFKTALHMHKNPLFLLICVCRAVFMLTFIPMVTIVVDFAVDQGIRHTTGKYIIATLSLGDLLGRLCLGWVTDIGCITLSRYMMLVMLLLGCSTASLPFMTTEVSLMPTVLVFGMLQGSLFVRHQILVSKYMQAHEQAIGMGFINLLSGFLGFTLPYYIGYFRDTKGSYNGMLYVNGSICACVGLLWMFEPYFVRFTPRGRQEKYKELVRGTGI